MPSDGDTNAIKTAFDSLSDIYDEVSRDDMPKLLTTLLKRDPSPVEIKAPPHPHTHTFILPQRCLSDGLSVRLSVTPDNFFSRWLSLAVPQNLCRFTSVTLPLTISCHCCTRTRIHRF